MVALLTAFLMATFEARWYWWLAFVLVVAADIFFTIARH